MIRRIRRFFSNEIRDAVDNYYHYNPDTLMPLLMVALAGVWKEFTPDIQYY